MSHKCFAGMRAWAGAALVGWSVVVLAGCVSAPRSAEPLNLSAAKAEVTAYIESGAYERDLAAAAAPAKAFIEARAEARRPGERLAVVMDIDETVLSNLPQMRAEDFGYNPAEWEVWTDRASAPALVAVREVYRTARAKGVAVLFLTGRKDPRERASTELNLRREGLGDYEALRMTKPEEERTKAAERKAAARAAWAAEGWTIIATIGDQESDLVGGHAERAFKLPNPFYFIP